MSPIAPVALMLVRLAFVVLAGRELLGAAVLPRGRRRERRILAGGAWLVAACVRV